MDAHIQAASLDDLLRSAIKKIRLVGRRVVASKGANREISGLLLELSNPRARLSRTESRGKIFSCLGELCWYLSGSNETGFIVNYIRQYEEYDENGTIFGGYGPRLFKKWKGVHQFKNVLSLLKRRESTRQATLQLFDASDLVGRHKDVPCTCSLQFVVRDHRLHLFTCMRSNDVIKGLPHDVFCFTMLQEMVARDLSVELGTYKHFVGSLHLYDSDKRKAQDFLDEAWQATKMMPSMPRGNPWPSIRRLLKAESAIRTGKGLNEELLKELPSYWADLVRLLQIFSLKQSKQKYMRKAIEQVMRQMASSIYNTYIERILN